MTKFPGVFVPLAGEDGNAYAILGRVERAMRRAGISQEDRAAFRDEATSGDYDNLIRTVMRWVDVFGTDEEDF